MTNRRKATIEELKELAKAVKNYCTFCTRQDNKYDAFDIADECKKMIDDFTQEFITSVPVYLYLWNKIDRTVTTWSK